MLNKYKLKSNFWFHQNDYLFFYILIFSLFKVIVNINKHLLQIFIFIIIYKIFFILCKNVISKLLKRCNFNLLFQLFIYLLNKVNFIGIWMWNVNIISRSNNTENEIKF